MAFITPICNLKDTMNSVHTSIRILRKRHGCKLPIEIFAFPEELTEQPGTGLRGQIEALGDVTFKKVIINLCFQSPSDWYIPPASFQSEVTDVEGKHLPI